MLEGFPQITGITSEGRFSVQHGGETITVFTARSAERDLTQLRNLLQSAAPGNIPVIVAPYRSEFSALFTGQDSFVFIAPVAFAAELPDDERLIAGPASLEYFVNSIDKDDKYEIHVAPQWQALAGAMREATQQLFERAAVRLKTIGHFGRLWQINFRLNAVRETHDITGLKQLRPDLLVMAGPSLDARLGEAAAAKLIWCADTALPALAARNIYPRVVFSVDAGFASSEHFCGLSAEIGKRAMVLVCDLLGNAAVQRLPFAQRLTYQSSHPLVQHFCSGSGHLLTALENPRGDVGSLMRIAYQLLFSTQEVGVIGHDGRSCKKITHARGTAYFKRSYSQQNRLFTPEAYLARLSRRYG
ncbi:MAG: hypothetical protein U1F27_04665 [Turneriella sp.]